MTDLINILEIFLEFITIREIRALRKTELNDEDFQVLWSLIESAKSALIHFSNKRKANRLEYVKTFQETLDKLEYTKAILEGPT